MYDSLISSTISRLFIFPILVFCNFSSIIIYHWFWNNSPDDGVVLSTSVLRLLTIESGSFMVKSGVLMLVLGNDIDCSDSPIFEILFFVDVIWKKPMINATMVIIVKKINFFLSSGRFCNFLI